MERKRLLIFVVVQLVALLWSANGWSQDIVYKRDSKTIEAIIEEITDYNITYHKYDDPFGPIQKIAISKVAKIVYENGYEEVFNEKEVAAKIEDNLPIVIEQAPAPPKPAPAPPKPKPQLEPPTQSLVVKGGIDLYHVNPRLVANNKPDSFLIKPVFSLGLYNIADSRWGVELSLTYASGLKELYAQDVVLPTGEDILNAGSGELSGVVRLGDVSYFRMGGGALLCEHMTNAGAVVSAGFSFQITKHLFFDIGLKWHLNNLVVDYAEQVFPAPDNSDKSYTYHEVFTAFPGGFNGSVGTMLIGLAF